MLTAVTLFFITAAVAMLFYFVFSSPTDLDEDDGADRHFRPTTH